MKNDFLQPDLTMLIVEDDRSLRKYLAGYFKKRGVKNIHEASTGSQALEICSQKEINFIISDWNMPQMSGIELLRQIRCVRTSYGEVPFIMITALRNKNQIKIAKEAGVDDFLIKPFKTNLLEERFEKVLMTKMFETYVHLSFRDLLRGNYEKAREKLFKAFLQRKSDTLVLCGLTICNSELGHAQNAQNYFNAIIDDDPTEIYLYSKAVLENAMGAKLTSIKTLRKCQKLHPGFIMAYQKAMQIHIKFGEFVKAQKIKETIENIKISTTYDFKILGDQY
jgi:two-component system, chemotaxis family, chemotaxis protein CheY